MKKNQKVRNATPVVADGIKFRSKLEKFCYEKLKEANIFNEYEQYHFELIPAFEYKNKKYRAITYKPDFVGDTFIIECKGFPNDSWALREKLFNRYLYMNNVEKDFYIVHTQKEVIALIETLKNKNNICQNS